MWKLGGIFWKIFFAFWLANIIVLGVTAYVIVHSIESSHFKERHKVLISNIANQIIERHERGQQVVSNDDFRRILKRTPSYRPIYKFPLRIRDEKGHIVFEAVKRRELSEYKIQLPVVSEAGMEYRVDTTLAPPPRFILSALRRINILQFVLLLVASLIVSFGLSWSLSRPLKKLGESSRRYGNGESLNIEEGLLRRSDEIGELARDFTLMWEQVEKNIQTKRQLLHDVSHELRAPLARLQAAAGLLQPEMEEDSKHIERIHHECSRINSLIQRILDFSRLEQVTGVSEEIELVSFIERSLENARYEYSTRKFLFKASKSTVNILGQPDLLDHTVGNILSNACKYSPEAEPIDINLVCQQASVCVTVRDHGMGVKEAELPMLLKPFYRGGNAMHGEGYGLGLSIAKRALEGMGGDIRIENHPQGGLQVCLTFPYPALDKSGV